MILTLTELLAKRIMKKIICFFSMILLFVGCASERVMPSYVYEPNTEHKKAATLEIMQNSKCLGFVYRYNWENDFGELRHEYFIHDLHDHIVGYVGYNGNTIAYKRNGEHTSLGNNTLDNAVQKIFKLDNNFRLYFAGTKRSPKIGRMSIENVGDTSLHAGAKTARPNKNTEKKNTEKSKELQEEEEKEHSETEETEETEEESEDEEENWGDVDNEEW